MQAANQIEVSKFVLTVDNAAKIHHIVIFLLPNSTLDPNMAASVYFQLPGKDFQLLGAISNEKPSAIFKINSNSLKPTSGVYDLDDMVDDGDVREIDASYAINIGISLEPMSVVEQAMIAQKQQQAITPSSASTPIPAPQPNPMVLAQLATKIFENAYNFMSGFTGPDGKVPLKAFDEWWNKFRTKVQNNPKFLDS